MNLTEPKRLRGLDRGERCALLISECQTAVIDPEVAMFKDLANAAQARALPTKISAFAHQCRNADIPVVHCIVRLLPGGKTATANSPIHSIMRKSPFLHRDHPASNIHPGIAVGPSDIISDRAHGITAFHDSGLETALRALNVETLILTGVSTNIALIGASIEAVNRGFSVVIAEDCTAGATPETHAHSIEQTLPILGTVCSTEAIIPYLRNRTGVS
ncbi:MAG: cysteine hydrolase [Sphingobium phenoxybenzoativorans]|uniref:cysteine hydrolase n=1 Tax=Sphingobium phenoxybenzoativorans TaxID=1592790 RepID=UPI000872F274|nr:cysteine hydrolase [Sphingobium phenoxybenzoativorans]